MIKEHSQIVVFLMGAFDLAITAAAWLLCFYVRFYTGWFPYKEPVPPTLSYVADVIVISLLLTMLVFSRLGMYRPRRIQKLATESLEIIRACLIVWVITVVVGHFLHSAPVSRKLQGMFLLVWPIMLIASRGTARLGLRFVRRRGRNTRSVAIVGSGRLGQKLLHTLSSQPWTGYETRYFVADRQVGEKFLGVPVRGPIEKVDEIVRANPVDAVFVAISGNGGKRLSEVLGKLSTEMVDVNVVPDLLSYHFLRHRVQQIGSLPVVNLTHSPQSGWNAATKRVFDVVFSLAAMIVLSLPMLIIAAAVKLSSRGAVFYKQRRASLGGQEFSIIKFRSMVPNAESIHDVLGPASNDPRITPIGKV
ncbi:MAG: sugar transferase, partial [Phycisphaerae bacterium]|nr:sugar transferase [Phycisphaerae bacterium]